MAPRPPDMPIAWRVAPGVLRQGAGRRRAGRAALVSLTLLAVSRGLPAQAPDSIAPIPPAFRQHIRVHYEGPGSPREAFRVIRGGPDSLVFESRGARSDRVAMPWSAVRRIEVGRAEPANPKAAGWSVAWKGAIAGGLLGAGIGALSQRAATGAAAGAFVGGWFGYILGGQGAERRTDIIWRVVYSR